MVDEVAVDLACQRDRVVGHDARLGLVRGALHGGAERHHRQQHVLGVGEVGEVDAVDRGDGVTSLAQDRAQARAGVLHIRPGLAFEVEHRVPVELDVLDAAVLEVVEDDRRDAHLFGDRLLAFEVRVLLGDDLPHLVDGFIEDLVEEDRVAAARRELFPLALWPLREDQAEGHVLDRVSDRLLHLVEHALELREVQLLLGADDVEDPGRVEPLLAVKRRGEVARVVERRPVGLAQQARHLDPLLLERDHLGPLALLKDPGGLDALHRGLHLVLEERLARNVVEGHAEARIGPLKRLE